MSRRWTAIAASLVAYGVVTMVGVVFVFRPVAAADTISPPWPPLIAIAVYLVLSVALLDWSARRMRSSYAAAFVIAAAQSILIVDRTLAGSSHAWGGREVVRGDRRVENLAPADYTEGSELLQSLVLGVESIGKRIGLKKLARGE